MIKKRKIHLEILRLIAIYFVIFNHTGVNAFQAYSTKEPGSLLYNMYLIMAIVCKIAVPLFFMISGATLLGKTESIKDLYFKRVFKIVEVLLLFSFIQYIRINTNFDIVDFTQKIYQKSIITQYWFLYAYIAFLIILPILRIIAKNIDKKEVIYLFLLWIVSDLLISFFENTLQIYRNVNLTIPLFKTIIIYPILGYSCEKFFDEVNKKLVIIILFIITIFATIFTIVLTNFEISKTGDLLTQKYIGTYILPHTVLAYLTIKYIVDSVNIHEKIARTIAWCGSCVMGIYLLETFLHSFMYKFAYITKGIIGTMPAFLGGIFVAILIGLILVSILKHIPIIKHII